MCNKISFLHDSVHIHDDGSSEILRNLQESVYFSWVVVELVYKENVAREVAKLGD